MTDRAPDASLGFLAGGGEVGARMRGLDWSATPLGPAAAWPPSLRTAVSICLASRFPMLIWWGPALVMLYNDAYAAILGNKHPQALGSRGLECWAEIGHIIGPMLRRVMEQGEATWSDDQLLHVFRSGYVEEAYFTFSYSPIRDEQGVGGVFTPVTETTGRVVGERRLSTLRVLAEQAAQARTVEAACEATGDVLACAGADVPFALLYLLEDDGRRARLASACGLPRGSASAPIAIELGCPDDRWSLAAAVAGPVVVEDVGARFGSLHGGPWPEPVHAALVQPVSRPGLPHPYGLLVSGVSPRRALDEQYRSYFALVAEHVATAIANARAYEEERRRAEALAELDRAKTAFFSNVSHEFRTPLTLMLGPIQDLLGGDLPPDQRETVETLQRNGQRLLRLVNALLDFSRIQSGRVQPAGEPTDLAEATRETAALFRAAVQQAGLTLDVDCPPLRQPVWVDRDMWEKVVLNLLSNALKFTFEGGIQVALRERDEQAVLTVLDTGVGIPLEEQPRLFERFHRVPGTRSRSHEGTGIGLALVQELVRLHGGTVEVRSEPGRGTAFTVAVPLHSPLAQAGQEGAPPRLAPVSTPATAFMAEAAGWTADRPPAVVAPPADARREERILVADDNADMRAYLQRVLGVHWAVETVADGEAALAAARERRPDLVLADVMMPVMDGFRLLAALRADPATRDVRVVMLSARAGEEARTDGLDAGADDYLVKPFASRELVARVRTQLAEARARREVEAAARAKDEFLAMLGHELRNPLSPILTALELMRLRAGDVLVKERAIVERQVRHMVRLVDDLLDVSRITRGKVRLQKRPQELAAVVAKAVEMASPLLEQRMHALKTDVPAGLRVDADEGRLAQVISNLLANAAKYTPPHGQVELRASAVDGRALLSVRDSGIGISPALLPRVFDRFVQGDRGVDRAEGGLGLGLAIVKNLVELHGGRVSAASEGPGRGSEFSFTLPLAGEASLPAPRPEPAASDGLRPARRRILIVDDNADAASLTADALREIGHDTCVAFDGPSALDVAREFQPELALVDIGLPVMDGYELAARLRSAGPADRMRMIAVTGYGQDTDRQRARDAGFDDHLVKPAPLDAVQAIISRLFGEA